MHLKTIFFILLPQKCNMLSGKLVYFHIPNALRNQGKSPEIAIDNVIQTTLLDECAMKVLSILNPVYN